MRENRAKYREKSTEIARLWRKRNPDKMRQYYIRRRSRMGVQDIEKKKEYMKEYGKKYRCFKNMGLTFDIYEKMTKKCSIKDCRFSLTVDLHHIDKDKNNNNVSNLIGLCPSHHQLIHRYGYKLEQAEDTWILIK